MSIKVCLDSNVIIQEGGKFDSPLASALKQLVVAKKIEVYETDLILQEVAKHLSKHEEQLLKNLSNEKFRYLCGEIFSINFPALTAVDIFKKLLDKNSEIVKNNMDELGAKILPIDDATPSEVFADYATSSGLFSLNGKKNQFPDAFNLARLVLEATDDAPMHIVSSDKDFNAVETRYPAKIVLVKSIEQLLTHLNLRITGEDLKFIQYISNSDSNFLKLVNESVSQWGFVVRDIVDGEIELADVTSATVSNFSCFQNLANEKLILVVGAADIEMDLDYSHPDWDGAIWNSEDKIMTPWQVVNGTVSRSSDVLFSLVVEVDDGGMPKSINDFELKSFWFLDVDLEEHDW